MNTDLDLRTASLENYAGLPPAERALVDEYVHRLQDWKLTHGSPSAGRNNYTRASYAVHLEHSAQQKWADWWTAARKPKGWNLRIRGGLELWGPPGSAGDGTERRWLMLGAPMTEVGNLLRGSGLDPAQRRFVARVNLALASLTTDPQPWCATCQRLQGGKVLTGLLGDVLIHGNQNTYLTHGCRCPDCAAAHEEWNASKRLAKAFGIAGQKVTGSRAVQQAAALLSAADDLEREFPEAAARLKTRAEGLVKAAG